jgi:hypothetical protein
MRAGLPKRTRREVNVLLVGHRTERVFGQVRDKVVDAYAKTGLLKETVRSTGVGYHLARRVLSEAGVPHTASWRLACPNPRVISARDATRMLKEASKAFGGKMSAREYREFAQTRVMPDGQPWPKSQALRVRMT